MFNQVTLRQRFFFALLTASMVIVSTGISIRLLSKAALFHHLEHDRLGVMMQATNALTLVFEGGRSVGEVQKKDFVMMSARPGNNID